MAFQTPLHLHNLTHATSGIWPAVEKALKAPWKQFSQQASNTSQPRHARPSTSEVPVALEVVAQASQRTVALPECIASVSVATLGLQPSTEVMRAAPTATSLLTSVSRNALRRCNPIANRIPRAPSLSRPYSILTRLGPFKLQSVQRPSEVMFGQYRTLFGANASRNLLAHMEQTANNNPSSGTAQNAFYSALLRANMPEIVVERYQTGRYASNPACEALYIRALERVGESEKASAIEAQTQGGNSSLTAEQIQSIGQAIGAKSRGGNIAKHVRGSGTKEGPLYVVVDESTGSTLFKWAKFLLWFGLTAYFSVVLVTLFIEGTGALRRVGGTQNAEVRPELQTTRFSDVHGCDEAKEDLQELVDFLKSPDKFSALGGKLPKGVLLVGPPGTGKTLLARAVAGEAGVPFFYMSGSEFDEVYVGVGAKRVRELFNAARSKAPAIVFIDELDAIGGKRNERDAAYVKQTLNQLLTDLDGFDQNSGVVFLAATNFPQLLDKALLRPGRFDRNITVPLPDVRGRVEILKYHMRNIQLSTDVDAANIARGTPGFSGAELENVVNQAAVRASKSKSKKVSMADLDWAKDKILMGAERRSAVIQEKDKLATAYHEGGHALIMLLNPNSDPLYKATIMPRGQSLGLTMGLPEMDAVSRAKKQYLADIDVCMGGKVAEEIIYGQDGVTSGATSDLEKATRIAFAMVTQFGMSEVLGNVDLGSNYNQLSAKTKGEIESEVRRLLEEGKSRATTLLTEKRKELELLAKALVEYETLSKAEIEQVIRGEKLPDRLKSLGNVPIKLPETIKPASPPSVGGIPGNENPGTGVPTPTPGHGGLPRSDTS